jgi:hypothetical protein
MANQRQYHSNTDQQLNSYDTIESVFGVGRKYEEIRDNSKYIAFAGNLKEIQDFCRNRYIDLGEALIMLRKTFNYLWDTIPFGKMDEVKQWFENNWFRSFAILEPEKHQEIMQMQSQEARHYQAFYNSNGVNRGPMGNYPETKTNAWWNND